MDELTREMEAMEATSVRQQADLQEKDDQIRSLLNRALICSWRRPQIENPPSWRSPLSGLHGTSWYRKNQAADPRPILLAGMAQKRT